MARCFTYFVVYLLLLISLTYGEHTTARPTRRTSRRTTARPTRRTTARPTSSTDHEYYISKEPYECCPTVQNYSKENWNKLISSKVKFSDFDELQETVINTLRSSGLNPSDPVYKNGLNSNNKDGLINTVLTLYTDTEFYKDFNIQTKKAIEGKIDFEKYPYPTEYALINQAYEERSRTKKEPLFRGVSATFKGKKGETFSFNHFASTSELKNMAFGFTRGSGTLFEIHGGHGIPMSSLSFFRKEREYLLHPFEQFVVGSTTEETMFGMKIMRVVLCRKSIPKE